MRISDWSSDVCSSDLAAGTPASPDLLPDGFMRDRQTNSKQRTTISLFLDHSLLAGDTRVADPRNSRTTLRPAVTSHRPYSASVQPRSEEHTSELQSLMRISYDVFCFQKKKKPRTH